MHSKDNIGGYLDSTLLAPGTTESQVEYLCFDAIAMNARAVCVNSFHVDNAANIIRHTDIAIISTIGFPLGAVSNDCKCFELEKALKDGATEFDFVMNIGNFMEGKWKAISDEIESLKKIIKPRKLKMIIETPLLADRQIENAALIACDHGLGFVKTGTGFSGQVTEHTVQIIKNVVKETETRIKASGGIKTFAQAKKLIEAGAWCLGTSKAKEIWMEQQEELNAIKYP